MVYTPVSSIILFFGQSQKAFWLSKKSTNLYDIIRQEATVNSLFQKRLKGDQQH